MLFYQPSQPKWQDIEQNFRDNWFYFNPLKPHEQNCRENWSYFNPLNPYDLFANLNETFAETLDNSFDTLF